MRLPVYDYSDESNGDELGVCYQLLGGDEDADVFPLAVFCFSGRPTPHDYRTDLYAKLQAPAALRGLAMAVVDIENMTLGPQINPLASDNDPNVDMEFVGIQGYVYFPPCQCRAPAPVRRVLRHSDP